MRSVIDLFRAFNPFPIGYLGGSPDAADSRPPGITQRLGEQ